jgi:hypothetical protein
VQKGCCPPELITVVDKKKSFIISATTRCLEPGTYYTLQVDRETPIEAFGLDTYIFVEPCGFFRGEVGLNFSKAIHHRHRGGESIIGGDQETLESPEIDGSVFDGEAVGHGGMIDEQFDGGKFGCAGLIPDNPAFPAQDFVGVGFRKRNGVLVPVVLDLLGDIATGKNFATGRFKVPGTGLPYSNRFVLFYNNAGKFVLNRNWRRRSDFA